MDESMHLWFNSATFDWTTARRLNGLFNISYIYGGANKRRLKFDKYWRDNNWGADFQENVENTAGLW